jgi:hypothetical protein
MTMAGRINTHGTDDSVPHLTNEVQERPADASELAFSVERHTRVADNAMVMMPDN